MTRKAVVAGMFYPDDLDKLDKEINRCFTGKFGPGELPVSRRDKKVIGVVAPHAGYQFSGEGQAWCYKEIGESEEADTYVILGTAHSGFLTAAIDCEDFETPFGIVKIDKEFCSKLVEQKAVQEDKYSHIREHSIEVQLPFLQFVNKDNLNSIQIVPIVVGHETDYESLGKTIVSVAKGLGRRIVVIASSDFTHYGPSYGYIPFEDNVQEKLKELDMDCISWIKKMDAWSFVNHIEEKKMTVCGGRAIAAMIVACKELGCQKVRVEQYYSSGEITNDWNNAVGYASIILE